MVTRHGVDRQTLVERVAAELDAELLDLRPFLADGVAGLHRWINRLTFALQLAGAGEEDLSDLVSEIGVNMADVYRVLLGLRPVQREGN
jgi:hypothetical protein